MTVLTRRRVAHLLLALVGVLAQDRARLATVVGRADLADDPRMAAPLLSPDVKRWLFGELGAAFSTRTTDEWCAVLREEGFRHAPVRDYVMNCKETEGFKTRFTDMIDYMLPLYIQEGKSQLVIAVGCTGGNHRSVALAQYMHDHLVANGVHATVSHRDITKQ